jgi:cytochrome P450
VQNNLIHALKLILHRTTVIASAQVLMKDPRIWPDPESFIPERWLAPYKGVEVDRKAFLPFSAGSRNCIGMQFVSKIL